MQPPPTLDEQMAGAPPALGLPPGMLAQAPQPLGPPPAQMQAAGPLTLPPGMLDQPQASALLQAPPGMAAATAQVAPEPQLSMPPEQVAKPERDVLAGIDPNDAIALATRSAEVSRDVQRANLAEAQRLDVAVKEEAEKQERQLAERAEREERARERVAAQNAEVQSALRAGPEGTWRDVAQTGTQALFAVLGAAFDRSGLLQQALPQTLNGIMQQGQERVQSAFARQLQALQVGREQAGDELDAAMDDERRIEAAGASARTALIEESMRQMDLAVQQGKVDLATLEAAGVPGMMQGQLKAATDKQVQADKDAAYTNEKRQADLAKLAEDVRASKVKTSQDWARINLEKQKQAADEKRLAAQSAKDALAAEEQEIKLKVARENLSEVEAARLVRVPGQTDEKGGQLYVTANTKEEAAELRNRNAAYETLGTLLKEMIVEAKKPGSTALDKAQTARWAGTVTELRELANTGTLDKGAMDFVAYAIGDDPATLSLERLRDQVPQLQAAERVAGIALTNRMMNKSRDFAARARADKNFGVKLPDIGSAEEAALSADEVKAILRLEPGAATGTVPVLKSTDVTGFVDQLRASYDRQQSAGELPDFITGRGKADKKQVLIHQAYALTEIVQGNLNTSAEIGREIERLQSKGKLKAGEIERVSQLTKAQKNLDAANARIAVALERERMLLADRAERSDGTPADAAALEAVEAVIGKYGKRSKGREMLKARGEDR